MLDLHSALSFFTAALVLALLPGPDNIFVLTQSITQGRKAGLFVALGLASGLIFHTTAVTLGVATLFKTSALAFRILTSIGATYLLFLAWKSFTSHPDKEYNESQTNQTQNNDANTSLSKLCSKKLYARGVIMNITNPKVTLFFLAFLPQFVNPNRGSVSLQMISLGFIFIIATLIVFSAIAFASGSLSLKMTNNPKTLLKLDRLAGVVFTGLALKLLF